jgi:hypothetical protein
MAAVSLRETNNEMGTVFDFFFLSDLHSALLGNESYEGLGVGHRDVLRRRHPPHMASHTERRRRALEGTTSPSSLNFRMMSRVIYVSQSTQ